MDLKLEHFQLLIAAIWEVAHLIRTQITKLLYIIHARRTVVRLCRTHALNLMYGTGRVRQGAQQLASEFGITNTQRFFS